MDFILNIAYLVILLNMVSDNKLSNATTHNVTFYFKHIKIIRVLLFMLIYNLRVNR